MKKAFAGLFIIAAILTTGCLGNAPEQIVGTWTYVPINPNTAVVHPMQWSFQNNGQVYFTDMITSATDTGAYELYMNGTHKMLKISDSQIKDPYLAMNGEWYIVKIDFNQLVVGTKDYGGFQQRDLIK